jgi:IS605 OrfB family transposase
MTEIMRTFGDRTNLRKELDALAGLHCLVERKLYVQLAEGRFFVGDLSKTFYQDLGICSNRLSNINRALAGKLSGVRNKAAYDVATFADKIATKQKQIRAKEKDLAKVSKICAEEFGRMDPSAVPGGRRPKIVVPFDAVRYEKARTDRDRLNAALNQHKRRLQRVEYLKGRFEAIAFASVPPMCFGTSKLFNAQHHRVDNGYADHAAWKKDLDNARSNQFFVEGDSLLPSGNRFVRLTVVDGEFVLEIRLPDALKHLAERIYVSGGQTIHSFNIHGLRFPYGGAELRQAIRDGRAISWRFVRDGSTWHVFASVKQEHAVPYVEDRYGNGAIGVDFNADHVSATQVDKHGNFIRRWRFPLVTIGKTADQRQDAVRQVAARVVALAARLKLPLVGEKLDFRQKKAQLTSDSGPRYARMLSSLAYSTFGTALDSACARSGIHLRRVNAAYTSIIGHMKFARRYGLSVHAAAAMSIARRAMALSERVPDPLELMLEGGDQRTLRRPEWKRKVRPAPESDAGIEKSRPYTIVEGMGRRHVWSAWRKVAKDRKAALAEHFRAQRLRSALARQAAIAARSAMAGDTSRKSTGAIPVAKWRPSVAAAVAGNSGLRPMTDGVDSTLKSG